jgi:hypothetical protein
VAEPAHRGPQDPWGRKGPPDLQDPQERQVQPVHKDRKVLRVMRAQQDLQAPPARLVLKGRQESRGHPVRPGRLAPWDLRDLQDLKGQQGHKVQPVLSVPWDQQDLQEPPAQQVLKGQQGQLEHKAQPAVSAP